MRTLCMVACLAVVASIASCATGPGPSMTTTTWQDPTFKGPPFTKLFIVALTAQSLDDQRGFENFMRSTLQTYGIPAVAGWQFIPGGVTPDQAMVRAAVARSGADAALLVRLSDFTTETSTDIVQGVAVPTGPSMYVGWYQPSVVSNDYQAATIYTTLFDVKTERPVWTYNVPTYNPGMMQDGGRRYADDVGKILSRSGLVGTL